MKYIFTLIVLSPILSYGQILEQNKIDEFTNDSVKITSWETLSAFRFSNKFYAFTRFRKIDSIYFLDLKLTLRSNSVFAIDQDDKLMIKTADSIITLPNIKYKISCTGCGVIGFTGSSLEGIEVTYQIPLPALTYLLNHKILKIRIYTSDMYVEDEIKSKNSEIFKKQANLVY